MEKFEIRTDVIINYYTNPNYPASFVDMEFRKMLINFLFLKDCNKAINTLYPEFLERSPISNKLLLKFPKNEPYDKIKIPSKNQMRIIFNQMIQHLDTYQSNEEPFNWYVYGFSAEINNETLCWGVVLNQRVEVYLKRKEFF
ncbi:MAG: hypothetical protein ACJA0X_003273 [Cyclobacteriaceae bacterium]|jgi:hypothetical protein